MYHIFCIIFLSISLALCVNYFGIKRFGEDDACFCAMLKMAGDASISKSNPTGLFNCTTVDKEHQSPWDSGNTVRHKPFVCVHVTVFVVCLQMCWFDTF